LVVNVLLVATITAADKQGLPKAEERLTRNRHSGA
jgi:hypothetical protein